MEFYRAEGFGVALDDVGSGYSSLNLIHQIQPDYIKLDMELIRDVDRDPHKAAIAGRLLELAGDLGIQSIAEGVETAGTGLASGAGATYVQGYLIDRPQPLGQ
ncbi:MAG: EAL domain-containing protein [Thermomicrobiales bacterium]